MFVAARQRIGAIDRQRSLTGSANDVRSRRHVTSDFLTATKQAATGRWMGSRADETIRTW